MLISNYGVALLLFTTVFFTQIKTGITQEEEVIFNYSTHALFTTSSRIAWTTAQSNCMNWGGNLVTIDSKQVDSLLYYMTSGYTCWIGLNDRDNEAGNNGSAFVWVDGSTSTYRQWDTFYNNEPDGNTNAEYDCVSLRYQDGAASGWDDRTCTAYVFCYFCQKSGDSRGCDLIYNGSCYRAFEVSDGINWLDAQSSCAVWGGDLTSITTERENNLLYTAISDTVSNCWIGLYERDGDGVYQWVDGTALSYTNWTGGAPTAGSTTDCVQMNTVGAGDWIAADCEGTSNSFICKNPSTNTDTIDGRFGELINGRKDFQELSGNTFFFNSSLTLVCGGEENSSAIQWRYSQRSDLSSSKTLTHTYASTETGLSWITISNTQQGFYRCVINSSLSYTIGLYDLSLTAVDVSGSTYTYLVGLDSEEVLLLCDPMDSSVTLSVLRWVVYGGLTYLNPVTINRLKDELSDLSTKISCTSGGTVISHIFVIFIVPQITIQYSTLFEETFLSVYPAMNRITVPLKFSGVSLSININGKWNLPDNSNSTGYTIMILVYTTSNAGVYKFYSVNFVGEEVCVMQIELITSPVRNVEGEVTIDDATYGYFTTNPDRIPWITAGLDCIDWGGNLATIDSKQTDSLLYYMITSSYTCWIGLNDRGNEAGNNGSAFVWVDGSTSTYRQWNTINNNEPDGATNAEFDCVSFRYADGASDGWDDRECYASVHCYFCQKSGDSRGCDLIYNGSCYRAFGVSDGIKWLDAQSSCAVWGGDLTSISTERENNLLYTAISDTVDNCWIGLYERDGDDVYQWVDGIALSYTNWAADEPNAPTSDDCVEMNLNGNWTNLDCETVRNWFICETNLSNISPVNIFGELIDGSLNFRRLTGNIFLYTSTILACKGDVNSAAIVWQYSVNANLSSSEVLTATYMSTQTGVSWLSVDNTKQGYYQCYIDSTNRYTVGVYDTQNTTVASESILYQYIVGIDREDVVLLCDPMDSMYDLNSLSWHVNGNPFSNPFNIFSARNSLPLFSTEIICLSNSTTILTSNILIHVPEITITHNSSNTMRFSTLYPVMNTIRLEIESEGFSISGSTTGRWKLQNGTYVPSSTISYPILIYEYFGLYQFYVINWDGDEVCVIQITIIPEGYSMTNSISLSNSETIKNGSTIVITENSSMINCIISNPDYSVEWFYRSQLGAVQTDITSSSSTFSARTGISTLNVNYNQPGYYSCVINTDIVYSFFVADRNLLIEVMNFDSPSQQVDYIVGSTSSLLYYSDANIPDTSLRWTTETVTNGTDTQYSIEYENPVLLSTVFSDVGAGVQTFSCFYRMSPVTLVGSLQLAIRDTAAISISYAGYDNVFSDVNNIIFPSPQQLTIDGETQDVMLTCNLTQCMWMLQLKNRNDTVTMSPYIIPIFGEENEGNYSLIRETNTGKQYTTAHVYIKLMSTSTTTSQGIQSTFIVIPLIIIALLVVLTVLTVLFVIIIRKRRNGSSFKSRHLSTDGNSTPIKSQIQTNGHPEYSTVFEINNINQGATFDEQNDTKETKFTKSEIISTTYQNIQEAKAIEAPTYQEAAAIVNPRTVPIQLDIYKRYIDKIWQQQDSLQDEYASLGGKEHRYICTHAMMDENRIKNRFKQMYPYDQSRVVLSKINDDPNSDYINGSHIPGFYVKEKFIAAQAPKENTLEDFWRMIIENKLINIVMVTNLVESGRKKSEIYFPLKVGNKFVIGPYEIILDHEEVKVGYTIKMMSVHYMGNITQVKHFHFTAWPDHDVPTLYDELLLFVSKVQEGLIKTKAPMLVHCSAGVGRTGTFITLYNLQAAIQKGKPISIYNIVHEMREHRPQMVQTFAQYKFIYLSVLEMLLGKTSVPTEEYLETFNLYMQSETEGYVSVFFQQFSELNYQCEKGFDPVCKEALAECNKNKNPVKDILPCDNNRIVLFSSHWSDDYINATSLDNGEIVVTINPTLDTLRDFYQLIYMLEPSLVVMLCSKKELVLIEQNKSHRVVYWPKCGEHLKTEPFILTCDDNEKTSHFIRNTITIKHKIDNGNQTFTQIIANNWDDKEELNSKNTEVLMQTILEFKQHFPASPIIIHCTDGAGKSGVIYTVYRAIKDSTEKEYIDIFHIVKKLRNERMNSVTSLTHFVSCFTVMNEFLTKTQ